FPVVAAAPEPWLRRGKLERGSAEELQVLGPAVSVGKAPDHDEGGARMGLEELGHREGARGAGEAGDAQVDSSLGKGFCQRFECRPFSQHLREHTTVSRPLRRAGGWGGGCGREDRKSTRLNSSHVAISYAVFCLKKKKTTPLHANSPAVPNIDNVPQPTVPG